MSDIQGDPTATPFSVTEVLSEHDMQLRYVKHVLQIAGGNKTKAARMLGIDRRSLYRRLQGHT